MIHFSTTRIGHFSIHSSSKSAWQVFHSWMRRRPRRSRRRWMTERRTRAKLPDRLPSRVQDSVYRNPEKHCKMGSHTVGLGGLGAYYLANDPPRHLTSANHCRSPLSLLEKAVALLHSVLQTRKDQLWMKLIPRSLTTWCSSEFRETSSKSTLTLSKIILRSRVKVQTRFLWLAQRLRLMSLSSLLLSDVAKLLHLRLRLHLPQLCL